MWPLEVLTWRGVGVCVKQERQQFVHRLTPVTDQAEDEESKSFIH